MSIEELNQLVEDAYSAAFKFEQRLTDIYLAAFARAGRQAASNFRSQAVVAGGFVSPPLDHLSSGLTQSEEAEAEKVRRDAAEAVAGVLIALGLAAIAASFMAAVATRGETNFDDEILRTLRTTVGNAEREGWSADRTALAIEQAFKGITPATAQMLAQTELTTIVNERSLQAAQSVAENHAAPVYKVWQTMEDPKVRYAHAAAQGQTVPVSQPFQVGGYPMMYPGDTSAPMRLVARCRCRMSYSQSLVAAGALDASQMAMVAVYPRQLEARALAVTGGQPFESLHVTLFFLGDPADVEMADVNEVVGLLARNFEPLEGNVGGIGFFQRGPDGTPILALPDVPGLSCLREYVCQELASIGVESPSEHGWLPHATLVYAQTDALSASGRALGGSDADEGVFGQQSDSGVGLREGEGRREDDAGTSGGLGGESRANQAGAQPPSQMSGEAMSEAGAHGGTAVVEARRTSLPAPEAVLDSRDALRPNELTRMGSLSSLSQGGIEAIQAASSRVGLPLHFDTISVVVADVRTDYKLGGVPAASAEEDTLMPVDSVLTAATITITTDDEPDATIEGSDDQPDDPGSFRALLAIENQPTEDGRLLVENSVTWRDLPLSLMAMDTTGPGGHEGAQVAGRIDSIERDGYEIWGAGVFDSGEFGQNVRRMVGEQTLTGNSVDLAVTAFEYRDPDGNVLDEMGALEATMNGVPITFAVTEGVIMASTVCPTPAIAGAEIMLASGVMRMTFSFTLEEERGTVLTAAGAGLAPLSPPLEWFSDPQLDGPTPLTVTPEGRVYGHAALWNSCHIAEPYGPGVCVPPPRSGMSYEIFHHGVVTTAEGVDVPCGQITMSATHAGRDLGWKAALQHYENSAICAADVCAGEDAYGIYVAGGIRPDLSAEKLREMKGGSLSGDWREVIGRGLEFLGALVVNIPGFPIPRPEARIVASAGGEEQVLALVAAGIVTVEDEAGMSRQEFLRKIEGLTYVEYADGFAISQAERDAAAKSGAALPDGSYPITKCSGDGPSAENAIRAQGRAPDQGKVVAHIKKRVAALGCSGDIFKKYQ